MDQIICQTAKNFRCHRWVQKDGQKFTNCQPCSRAWAGRVRICNWNKLHKCWIYITLYLRNNFTSINKPFVWFLWFIYIKVQKNHCMNHSNRTITLLSLTNPALRLWFQPALCRITKLNWPCVSSYRTWTSIRSESWSGRLVSRPVSERGSGRCRRPDQNRPKRSTERGSSTRGRRPSSISKLSCLIWWDALQRFYFPMKLAVMWTNVSYFH